MCASECTSNAVLFWCSAQYSTACQNGTCNSFVQSFGWFHETYALFSPFNKQNNKSSCEKSSQFFKTVRESHQELLLWFGSIWYNFSCLLLSLLPFHWFISLFCSAAGLPAKYRMIFAKFVIVHGGWLRHIYQRSQNSFYLCFKINNLFYYRHFFFSPVILYFLSFEWHTLCLDDRREKKLMWKYLWSVGRTRETWKSCKFKAFIKIAAQVHKSLSETHTKKLRIRFRMTFNCRAFFFVVRILFEFWQGFRYAPWNECVVLEWHKFDGCCVSTKKFPNDNETHVHYVCVCASHLNLSLPLQMRKFLLSKWLQHVMSRAMAWMGK